MDRLYNQIVRFDIQFKIDVEYIKPIHQINWFDVYKVSIKSEFYR